MASKVNGLIEINHNGSHGIHGQGGIGGCSGHGTGSNGSSGKLKIQLILHFLIKKINNYKK